MTSLHLQLLVKEGWVPDLHQTPQLFFLQMELGEGAPVIFSLVGTLELRAVLFSIK